MKTRRCCPAAVRDGGNVPRPVSRLRRGIGFAGWILPGATLVLLPKCPVCVAMDIALFSGVGISVASASHLRTALVVLCVTALLCLALKQLCRLAVSKRGARSRPRG